MFVYLYRTWAFVGCRSLAGFGVVRVGLNSTVLSGYGPSPGRLQWVRDSAGSFAVPRPDAYAKPPRPTVTGNRGRYCIGCRRQDG